jgi:hypothetical protein
LLVPTEHPIVADGLPREFPSDRLRFSRLQLRGSAGIAPASLSSPRGEDAQTEGHFKEQRKYSRERNLVEGLGVSQISAADSNPDGLFAIMRSLSDKDEAAIGIVDVKLGHAIVTVE